ncbi:hypothetical protein Bca52824_026636 [Brassica carinata]|uniref:Uncharacterized protein n=1 Tax=Brassica carinata TaxID=52824 RepID=A0A8X7SI94_BRACI|nr:hypothetical protein Bca52824_026636 [Brassica carinata]
MGNYTSIKLLGDRVLVKIKEAEEKTMGCLLLESTTQSKNLKEMTENSPRTALLASKSDSRRGTWRRRMLD